MTHIDRCTSPFKRDTVGNFRVWWADTGFGEAQQELHDHVVCRDRIDENFPRIQLAHLCTSAGVSNSESALPKAINAAAPMVISASPRSKVLPGSHQWALP